jgi:hypothetical protein
MERHAVHLHMPVPHAPTQAPTLAALGALGAAAAIHYLTSRKFGHIDQRLCRMEDLGERIIDAERNVLAALHASETAAESAAIRMIG